MKIVVTGSAGFIGRNLYVRLIGMGHDVVGLDIREGNDILTCDLPDADLVFHLAAQTDATSADAEADARTNIMGLLRVLKRYGKAVVFASSSMVNYPVSPYAISKRAGEGYASIHGASVVRLCNIYGQGGHSVIEKFEEAAYLRIFGTGHQRRTYAPVERAVDLFCRETMERRALRVLDGETWSVCEIADRYPDKRRVHLPARDFDPVEAPQLMAV